MYTTAPMGMVQAVTPPVAPAPAYAPQAAPATARITQAAILGSPAAAAAADHKTLTSQLPPRTAAQIESKNAVTIESYSWQHEGESSSPAPTKFMPGTSAPPREPAQRLLGGRDSALAAQFMVQEDVSGVALPERTDITELMRRIADKRTQAQANDAQIEPRALPARNMMQQRGAQMLSFASMLSPTVIAMAKSQSQTVYAPLKRDLGSAVMNTKGIHAYQLATQRMGGDHKVPSMEEAESV